MRDSTQAAHPLAELLRRSPIYGRLSPEDRERVGAASSLRDYAKGEILFREGDPPDHLFTVVGGRIKVFKTTPAGREVILEIFGPGDPLGAVAVYERRPFPASAMALEESTCLVTRQAEFFRLLETHPTLARGLLSGLTLRLVELTNRLTELSGSRVETRLARFFLRLGQQLGRHQVGGVFIPLALSRQDLADLIGTTIETAIRVMSRWQKEGILETHKEGFLLADLDRLEELAEE